MFSAKIAVRGFVVTILSTLAVACSNGVEDVAVPTDAVAEESRLGAHFETFAGADGQAYFRFVANNGEIVLSSEGYTRKEKALAGIQSVEENGVDEARFVVFATRGGQYAFHLVAKNGEVIATSESYVSKWNAQRAVATVASLLTHGVPTIAK